MNFIDDKDFAIRAPYIQKILELEAENAELKATIKKMQSLAAFEDELRVPSEMDLQTYREK